MRREERLSRLLLLLLIAYAHAPPPMLTTVTDHIHALAQETRGLFVHFCRPDPATLAAASFTPGEVNVPSCAALRDAGLETYYGNINMLMAEAWQSKIVPALQGLQNIKLQRSPAEPDMQMVLVREPADEDAVAGGVFVSQLIRWQDHQPQLARVALMIGLHRTPRHKSLRHLGLRPTDLLVGVALQGQPHVSLFYLVGRGKLVEAQALVVINLAVKCTCWLVCEV